MENLTIKLYMDRDHVLTDAWSHPSAVYINATSETVDRTVPFYNPHSSQDGFSQTSVKNLKYLGDSFFKNHLGIKSPTAFGISQRQTSRLRFAELSCFTLGGQVPGLVDALCHDRLRSLMSLLKYSYSLALN